MNDMSGLVEEAQAKTGGRGPRCQVAILLDNLPEVAAERVRQALDNPTVTNTGLARVLRQRVGDTAPSIWSIGNHRRGNCRCGR